jgi:hypothetical protein
MKVSSKLHDPAASLLGTVPPPLHACTLNSRLREDPSWSGYFGEDKNLLQLLGIKPCFFSYSLY